MVGDWSTMPLDLLVAIAMKLETCEDFIYFSVVCRWWNRVVSSIKNDWRAIPTPWLLLAENNNENPKCLRKIFNLMTNKCYQMPLPEASQARCSGSAYGWVAMIDRELNVQLFNPLSKAHISFPSLENIPCLRLCGEGVDGETRDDYINWCLSALVIKLSVLKAPQSCHHEFFIVAFYAVNRVAVARPGDESWTSIPVDRSDGIIMVDVVVMGDQVFGLYNDGRLVYWNANEFFYLELVKEIEYSPSQFDLFEDLNLGINKIYLVQSGTELIMALRYKEVLSDETETKFDDTAYHTLGFEIYKLNPTDKLWEEITDKLSEEIEEMGDEAWFLGCNSSMSVSNASGKCLKGGCVYFTDDETQFWHEPKEFAGHDMGVYDIKKNQICRFYNGDDTRSLTGPPTFFFPQL